MPDITDDPVGRSMYYWDGAAWVEWDKSVTTAAVSNVTSSGTIDANAETVECTVSSGVSTVGCQLTGTWAAVGDLITFEGTVDGTNWTSIYANLTSVGSLAVTVTGSNGLYQIAAAGMAKVRVRGSTWGTPGTCSVSFNSSVGSSASLLALPLPSGSNIIGNVRIDQSTPGTTNNVTVSSIPAVTGTVTIQDGGNTITVDGSVSADVTGSVTVTSGAVTVDGSVNVGTVTTLPSITGEVSILNGKTVKSVAVNISATGTVIAAVTSKKIKVFAVKLILSDALSINFRNGSSTLLEGPMPMTANSGYVESVTPPMFLFCTSAGEPLDLVIFGTGSVTGRISYWDDDAT